MKEITTHNAVGWLVVTILSVSVYAGLFLYLLGLKVLRHIADTRFTEIWLVTEVILGSLALVLTLEALVFILFDRNLSGRFFFLSVIAGACLIGWSTAALAEILGPVKAALGLGHYTWTGLAVGWVSLILSNVLCFFVKIPSLL